MEFIGKVTAKTATSYVGQNQSPTFEFMVEELNPHSPDYPNALVCKVLGKKVEEVLPFIKKGAVLKVSYDPRGRKWNDKLFGENMCWKVENYNGTAQPALAPEGNNGSKASVADFDPPKPAVQEQNPAGDPNVQGQGDNAGGGDDLPF